jgi:hypothetical protein
MKRPSFQFYPGDWQSDLKLRRCSPAARGVWLDLLCALHDSDDGYGLLRWPLKEIASTVGASMPHVRELVNKGVFRGGDTEVTEPLIYTPRTGRKDGVPVTLIATQPGPLWYSKRLVKDEYVRTIRGESSRFGAGDDDAPKPDGKVAPKPPFDDGTSSSSSSSSSKKPPYPRKRGNVHGFPPGFEEFWSLYPKKVAKDNAAKAFAKLAPDNALQGVMSAAVRRQAASDAWRKDGGQFVPNAATWINGRRWEDELPGISGGGEPWSGAL